MSTIQHAEFRGPMHTNLILTFHPLLVSGAELLFHRLIVLDGFNEFGFDKRRLKFGSVIAESTGIQELPVACGYFRRALARLVAPKL